MNAPKEYGWYTPANAPTARPVVIELPDGDHPDWDEWELQYTDSKGNDATMDTGNMTSSRGGEKPKNALEGRLVAKTKKNDTGSHAVIV